MATADPDGYTLLFATAATLGVIPALVTNPGFDPVKSFAAVARVSDSTTILVANANLPMNSISELIEYDRANPGKLSYASAGVGNLTHLGCNRPRPHVQTGSGNLGPHWGISGGAQLTARIRGLDCGRGP